VVGEEFRVEDYAGNVDAHAVDGEEEIKPDIALASDLVMSGYVGKSVHGYSSRQSGFVRRFICVGSDDSCFDDQADAAAPDADEHEWFATDFVHEGGADGVEEDADCDPAALELELLFSEIVSRFCMDVLDTV
jgi:hypothetical protein